MIRQTLPVNDLSWQSQLVHSISSIEKLVEYLNLPKTLISTESRKASTDFEVRVPLCFANKMEKANPLDPLLLQVISKKEEIVEINGFTSNPLHEDEFKPTKGILHKYHGRALVTLTGGCAVNCRYCFRREFPYKDNVPRLAEWDYVFNYLENNPEIFEVILSGGDPLLMPDRQLEKFFVRINQIPSIDFLRIHTRFPVVIPNRIDDSFINILSKLNKNIVFVLHINHPNEICSDLKKAVKKLINQGCLVFNQSVVLKGVNDDPKVLANLSKKLIESNITPYYLHMLDKVKGSHEFYLEDSVVAKIYQELLQLVPGYWVPKLVREVPNKPFKVPCNFIY